MGVLAESFDGIIKHHAERKFLNIGLLSGLNDAIAMKMSRLGTSHSEQQRRLVNVASKITMAKLTEFAIYAPEHKRSEFRVFLEILERC